MALSLLKNDTTCDRSLRAKSAKALADHDFLLQLLSRVSDPLPDDVFPQQALRLDR